ncbi:uncharacterized protein [Elaeis guineensis]|uniref:uncharacterized protein n=1 Tax=Elaeis guineensis var. tenera TaxID=51953 RepID=UPI003C6DAC27
MDRNLRVSNDGADAQILWSAISIILAKHHCNEAKWHGAKLTVLKADFNTFKLQDAYSVHLIASILHWTLFVNHDDAVAQILLNVFPILTTEQFCYDVDRLSTETTVILGEFCRTLLVNSDGAGAQILWNAFLVPITQQLCYEEWLSTEFTFFTIAFNFFNLQHTHYASQTIYSCRTD